MNLLDKNWFGLLIVATLSIFSCEDSNDIGLGLDPDGTRLNVLYAELPLETTNVLIDSIRTSSDTRLLVGRNSDPIFGDIVSNAYCRLSYANVLITSDTSLLNDRDKRGKQIYFVDSAMLYLQVSKVHSTSFTTDQVYNIYQLGDTLFSGPSYLSDFNTPYLTDQLEGQLSVTLNEDRIRDKDSLQYVLTSRLSDSFAEKIFSYVEDEPATASSRLFFDYKGIAIVGDEANTALVGFTPGDSSSIRIHYHIRDHYLDENSMETDSLFTDSLSMILSLNSAFYNGITVDRSGALMDAETGAYNSFSAGDGNVYLQPASGIYPKANLDTLVKFMAANPNIQINRMEFAIETSENSKYEANVGNLRFLYVDGADGSRIDPSGLINNNPFETAVMSDNGYLAGIPEIIVAPLDESSLIYTGIPTFFAQLVESGTLTVDHMILMPTDVSTPDFSILDQENGIKIKLYYTLPE
ncbi:MAG: DUF4270 family protein [Reichenbachiella sp.]|uniref:DUF4270 family protein n=1 Tax=Reichenbachiella sp. TaxID=2184521 RepID=UPI003267A341